MGLYILFLLANIYAATFWIAMIGFPRHKLTQQTINSNLIFLPLIAIYIFYLVTSFDLEGAKGLLSPGLSGLANVLASEGAAGGAWTHFLVMDLFVGRWIYQQGLANKIPTAHSLILCFLFGPMGLLSHLVTTTLSGKNSANHDQEAV